MKNVFLLIIAIPFFLLLKACSQPQNEQVLVESVQGMANHKAEILLKNFISKNPNSDLARLELARVMTEAGLYESALGQFNRISAPLSDDKYNYKIEALYFTQSFPEILKSLPSPSHVKLDTPSLVGALLHMQINEDDTYLRELKQLPSTDEGNQAILDVTEAIVDFSDTNNTSDFTDTLFRLNKKHTKLENNYLYLNLLGTFAFQQGYYEESADAFNRLSELRPEFLMSHLLRSTSLVYAKRFDTAKPILQKLLQINPSQPLSNQLYAFMAVAEKDYLLAKKHIELAIQNNFATRQNLAMAAEINFVLENYEQTLRFIERAFNNSVISDRYYNMALFSKTVRDGGESIVMDIKESLVIDSQAQMISLASLTQGLVELGDATSINRLFEKLSVSDNLPVDAVLDIAIAAPDKVKPKFGDVALAASAAILESFMADEQKFTARTIKLAKAMQVSHLISSNNRNDAIKQIQKWQLIQSDIFNDLLLSDIFNNEGKHQQTVSLLQPNLSDFNNAALFSTLSSAYYQTDDKYTALQIIKTGLKNYPYNLKLQQQFGVLHDELGVSNDDFMIELYNAKTPEATIALSIYFGIKQEFESARQALLRLPEELQNNFEWLYNLAEVNIRLNKKEDALSNINDINKLPILTIAHVKELLPTLKSLDANKERVQLLKNVFEKSPNNTEIKLFLCRAYLQNSDINAAQQLLQQIEVESADYVLLRAETALKSGQLKDAAKHYEKAFLQYPNDFTSMTYARFLIDFGESERAHKLLIDFIDSNPKALISTLLLATEQSGKEAIQNYERVLSLNPKNLIALNNTANELLKLGHIERALPFAERALQIAPENESVVDTINEIKEALKNTD